MDRFATWFKNTRLKRGLTQTEAADELHLKAPTVSRWESGTDPRAGHLLRVVRWGKISADKLLQMFTRA